MGGRFSALDPSSDPQFKHMPPLWQGRFLNFIPHSHPFTSTVGSIAIEEQPLLNLTPSLGHVIRKNSM